VPFDEALAEEIRGLLSDQDDLAERRMFGGLTESRLEWWVSRAVAFASALPSK